jgi:hypothetical protein
MPPLRSTTARDLDVLGIFFNFFDYRVSIVDSVSCIRGIRFQSAIGNQQSKIF